MPSIPYNPVFFSYAAITPSSAILYIDHEKLSPEAISQLKPAITIKPYDSVFDDATAMSQKRHSGSTISADSPRSRPSKFLISNKASWALSQALGGDDRVEEARSPIADEKAMKNESELKGMRNCHIRDGAALIEYFAWLEDQLLVKKNKLDEVEAANKLEQLRAQKDLFAGLSFPCISSTGANAAVIHYQPEPGNCSVVDPRQVYLCDSGAQYLDGTTDITRTLHFTQPTEMERKAYTLVLKGSIALEKAKFPKGASGFALDTLARQFLWSDGLDYRHGTGHGVGSYLVSCSSVDHPRYFERTHHRRLILFQNVHEGPIGIGTRVQYSEVPLSVGNVISNEPGYYEDNKFGIRIESSSASQFRHLRLSPLIADPSVLLL